MKAEDILSEIKKDYVLAKLKDGERIDGRKFDEFRKIEIHSGIIQKAEGSALVKLGNTQVVVGIKMQPGEPFPDTPDKGVIITNAELVPLASPTFEPGPPDEHSVELARVVDRGIRESEAIDLEKLCIEPGKKVWIIFIDIHAVDDDGNLMDASSIATISALLNTKVPASRFGLGEDFKLPIRDLPISVTSLIVGNKYLVDPSKDELSVGENTLTITTDKNDNIVAIQKSGGYMLSEELFYELLDVSARCARKIREDYLKIII
ncbi:MAG: exosome complex protein Rrp42 [Archaeoglobaceae archaeon]|nr:exosome complex protein Rrp42 [Archaeoglobaceae archaeon]MCX8151821.1 exosome complex protein Rrp42 [Archaeoglobaceae archaeon]MDW8014347.1 exosome complex protein Rrp42 [Archaeoglobaceae archaeon]